MRLSVFASARPPAIPDFGGSDGWRFETKALAPDFAHFEVRALASERPTISIFDYIGDDGAGGGVTPTRIGAALRSIGQKPITVEINSPGGNYFDGAAIYNQFQRHGSPITVQVMGMAASAASVIAMAGDEIQIAQHAQIMIHNARGLFYGTAADLDGARSVLSKCDAAMASLYETRTGLAPAKVKAMMTAETYITAADAVRMGFADSVMQRAAQPVAYAEGQSSPKDMASLDKMLAQSGMTRADRRELYRTIKAEPAAAPAAPLRTLNRVALLRAFTNPL